MAKQSKKSKADIDLHKPLPATLDVYTDPEDCFAKEWDPTHSECSVCSECDLCGTMFNKKVVAKEKELGEKEQFLDLTDFTLVDWGGILENIEGKNVADVFAQVQKEARTPDEVAVKNKLVEFLRGNNLRTENGIIKRK